MGVRWQQQKMKRNDFNIRISTEKTNTMKKLATFLFTLLSLNVFGQVESQIGKKAPDLAFDKILNSNMSSAKLSDYRTNKIVILEYWGTFCSSCISSFPHLEELQRKFTNDLQVITITTDSEKRIEQFLKKGKLNLPVAIDENGQLNAAFPHRIVPHTVLIDKEGIVRAITEPSEITEDLITKIINQQSVTIQEKKDLNFDPQKPLSAFGNINFQLTITPYQEGFPSYATAEGTETYKNRIFASNLIATSLYEFAYQFPALIKTDVEISDSSKVKWSKENAICFELILPDELADRRFEIMKEQLDIYFGYKATVEKREKHVKILQRIKGATINMKESAKDAIPSGMFGGAGLSMKASGINMLVDFIQMQLNSPVLDGTNLTGNYDFDVPWYNENPNQIYKELKKLGLELIDVKRKIEVLVIKDK